MLRHCLILLLLLAAGWLLAGPARSQSGTPKPGATPTAPPSAGAVVPALPGLVWVRYRPAPLRLGATDSAMRPHAAYYGYQADERGHLRNSSPGSPPAAQVAAAHRSSQGTPVLLRISYRELAASHSLFGPEPGAAQARQMLVDTLARQLVVTQADGLLLAIGLRPPVPAAPASRPLRAGEQARVAHQLNQERLALNIFNARLKFDAARLRAQLRAIHPAAEQARYDRQLAEARQRAADFRQRRTAYRRGMAALKQGRLLLVPASSVVALQDFVKKLRHRLEADRSGTTLALALPARDSARQYASLARLAPVVDWFEVPAPGLATPWTGRMAVSAGTPYYLAAGVPARQIRVAFPHPGPGTVGADGRLRSTGPRMREGHRHRTADTAPEPTALRPPFALSGWAHAGLFAVALLVGFVFLGGLVGALLRIRAITPFRWRLLRVTALLGSCLLLLLGYSYLLGPGEGQPLRYTCWLGLGLLAVGQLYHRARQPIQLP